jgi:hypothetical protein
MIPTTFRRTLNVYSTSSGLQIAGKASLSTFMLSCTPFKQAKTKLCCSAKSPKPLDSSNMLWGVSPVPGAKTQRGSGCLPEELYGT